jgi:hypothetical protein
MEIDKTETSRKRLREEDEKEEEFKELAKRAKVEILAEPEYKNKDMLMDFVQETLISNMLNFNADIFGGAVAFLGIQDIVKLNQLNRFHNHGAKEAVSYTETTTDVAWIRRNLIASKNPGKYNNVLMPDLKDIKSKSFGYSSDIIQKPNTSVVQKYAKRIWFMDTLQAMKQSISGYDLNRKLLDSMINLERVELNCFYYYYKFDYEEKQRYPIVLPESVWWLSLHMNMMAPDVFWGIGQFIPFIKTHIRYLKLYEQYYEIDPVQLLSNDSTIRVLHIEYSMDAQNREIRSGADTLNEMKRPLDMLLIDHTYDTCYELLKVNTVVIKFLSFEIRNFLAGIRYDQLSTLYLGDITAKNFSDFMIIHSLLPENTILSTLSRLIIKRRETTQYREIETDEDGVPFPEITNALLMDRWLPQISTQVIQFNHFPALKTLEIVLPETHNVSNLPITHVMHNDRVIIVYDEATKPANAFDIEKEVQKALLQ